MVCSAVHAVVCVGLLVIVSVVVVVVMLVAEGPLGVVTSLLGCRGAPALETLGRLLQVMARLDSASPT